MSETTTEELEWLSRNWTPSDTTFRQWIAGSTKAHRLISHLIADIKQAKRKRDVAQGQITSMRGMLEFQCEAINQLRADIERLEKESSK